MCLQTAELGLHCAPAASALVAEMPHSGTDSRSGQAVGRAAIPGGVLATSTGMDLGPDN